MKKNWETKKLSEVFEIKPSKREAKDHLSDEDLVSFVPMEDLGILSKDFKVKKERKLKEVSGSYTYFSNDDVLLAKITPCFENGKMGVARNLTNGIGFGSSEYIVFRSRGKLLSDYLFYYLTRDEFRRAGEKTMTGAVGHKRVSKDFVENQEITYPKFIEEQQRIITILDKTFSSIATVSENIKKNLQNTHELFESYLYNIFSDISHKWPKMTLNQISENLDSKRKPITKSQRTGGIYPYYGASGIVDYVDGYIFDENVLLISEDGANLLARSTPIAFSVSGKIWVNNHAHVLKFKNMETQKLVEMYFASISIDEYITGAAQPKLNQSALNSIAIPIPPLSEQRAIINKLEILSVEIKQLSDIYKQKLIHLEDLKTSILNKVFGCNLVGACYE